MARKKSTPAPAKKATPATRQNTRTTPTDKTPAPQAADLARVRERLERSRNL